MPWPKVLIAWLTEVRKAALVACVATVLGVLIPTWSAARSIFAIESVRPWSVPVIVFMCCVTAIMPTFYFALYRNEGTLHFSKRLRSLSLMAAIAYGLLEAVQMAKWSGTSTTSLIADSLAVLSDLATIWLLIVFFRHASDESLGDVPVSRQLNLLTKIAVITWGLVVAGCVVRLPVMPFVYIQLRDAAINIGRKPPQLEAMISEAVRTLLVQACLFVAPYVVYRSSLPGTVAVEPAIATP
jgi:hypothetical protein